MAATGIDIPAIAKAVQKAAKGTRITRAYLFGSRARNDARPDSDIDLCVEADRRFTFVDAGLFSDAVSSICGCKVDVISDRFLTPSTRESIAADKVLVYAR